MSLRWKIQAAFSIGLVLLITQALTTGYVIQELQEAISSISKQVDLRNKGYLALDNLTQLQKTIAPFLEGEAPQGSFSTAGVYQSEIQREVEYILTNLPQHKGWADTKDSLSLAFSKFIEEYEKFGQTVRSANERLAEQAFFLNDALSTVRGELSKLDVLIATGLEAAMKYEETIHNKPIRASMGICGIAALLLIRSAWIFARRIVLPIQRLVVRLFSIEKGNLDHPPLDIPGRDEIA